MEEYISAKNYLNSIFEKNKICLDIYINSQYIFNKLYDSNYEEDMKLSLGISFKIYDIDPITTSFRHKCDKIGALQFDLIQRSNFDILHYSLLDLYFEYYDFITSIDNEHNKLVILNIIKDIYDYYIYKNYTIEQLLYYCLWSYYKNTVFMDEIIDFFSIKMSDIENIDISYKNKQYHLHEQEKLSDLFIKTNDTFLHQRKSKSNSGNINCFNDEYICKKYYFNEKEIINGEFLQELAFVRFLNIKGVTNTSIIEGIYKNTQHIGIYMKIIQGINLEFLIRQNVVYYNTNVLKPGFFELRENDEKIIIKNIVSLCKKINKYNIIHRDIKPENIIIMENLDVHIIDFAYSIKLSTFIIKKHRTKGTPIYVPPESIINNIIPTNFDIWSIGIMLCELYVNIHKLYKNDSQFTMFNEITNISAFKYFLSNVLSENYILNIIKSDDNNLNKFILKLLNKNHNLRYNFDEIQKDEYLQ